MFIAAILSLVLVLSSFGQEKTLMLEKNGIEFSATITSATAEISVSAPTLGWVAVGFDPSYRMKGADFLIGYIKDGKVYVRDDFGVSAIAHQDDTKLGGRANILSYSGTEADNRTTITFVIGLDSSDPYDSRLRPGRHKLILGYSLSDSFTGMHHTVVSADLLIP